MPLSHSAVFYGDGSDENNNACGLTDAYMRFLLSLSSGHYSFINQEGERVHLTDAEAQIIENGNTKLSSIYTGACGVEIALRAVPTTNQTCQPNQYSNLVFGTHDIINGDLTTLNSSTWTINRAGQYLIMVTIGLHVPTLPSAAFRHLAHINLGGFPAYTDDRTRQVGESGSLHMSGMVYANQGTALVIEYFPFSPSAVNVMRLQTHLEVARIS